MSTSRATAHGGEDQPLRVQRHRPLLCDERAWSARAPARARPAVVWCGAALGGGNPAAAAAFACSDATRSTAKWLWADVASEGSVELPRLHAIRQAQQIIKWPISLVSTSYTFVSIPTNQRDFGVQLLKFICKVAHRSTLLLISIR